MNLSLFFFFAIFAVAPAGMGYFLWRLTRDAPPRWKLALRTASVLLICIGVAALLLLLLVALSGPYPD
jgi:hypothetical protein